LLAAAVALTPIPIIAAAVTPAAAQVNVNVNVGFDSFYNELAPYGDWYYHPRWGDVWHPTRVSGDFRPYYRGHWINTEYGWTWNSEDAFGATPYHYGRWVFDPQDGWLWVPGYTWAPAWVVWRGDQQNIGWFPMPPDDQFLAGVEVYRDDWDWNRGYYGYENWYGPSIATGLLAAWTFVALDRFADRDYYRYAYDRPRVVNIVNNTTNITNYVTVNNRIVNRSVDVARVERASGRRIQQVEARTVVRTPIETVDRGRQIATVERQRHGGNAQAPARERIERLNATEARTPVRERREARFQRNDQQQQAQPNGGQADRAQERAQQQQDRNATQRAQQDQRDRNAAQQQQQPDRNATQKAQQDQRDRNAAQQREERAQQQQRERDNRGAAVQQQQDRNAAQRAQQDQRDRNAAQQAERQQQQAEQNRARAEQQNRAQVERQGQAEQQNRARAQQAERQQQQAEQNRARAEQQNRAQVERQGQAEQQNRARAQQAERQQQQAEQNRARAEQQNRAQVERQAQAEQQNRARAQQAERQQQQAATQQQRARGKQQQKEEEEKQKRERN
jgi:hypothetical protein